MADARLEIKDVIIDCHNPERVARFWSRLLDRPITGQIGPYLWLERRPFESTGLGMGFQRVAEPKMGKNRLHLDLGSDAPACEQQRIEALGGSRIPGYEEGGFLVMADPEGNEFCVIPSQPFELDDEGRADYLTAQEP